MIGNEHNKKNMELADIRNQFREKLAHEDIHYHYDSLSRLMADYIPDDKLSEFHDQLHRKLNGAYRTGESIKGQSVEYAIVSQRKDCERNFDDDGVRQWSAALAVVTNN